MKRRIRIEGAREHNLRNITLEIPRDKFVVITGVSGSGKSSLAFDTIYAEGNRRYIESLNAYARQFMERLGKPDVDSIDGLPPTIAIDQSHLRANPRSTVATTTEIYDYLRVLYARAGEPHCPNCGRPVGRQSPQEIVEHVMRWPEGTRIAVVAPFARGRKGEHKETVARIRRAGFVRVRVNGKTFDVSRPPRLVKTRKYTIEAVVDRLILRSGVRSRLTDSVELALRFGEGLVVISRRSDGAWVDTPFSEHYACVDCGTGFEEMSPRMFSFNSPYGACPKCHGLGTLMKIDEEFVVPNPALALQEGAVEPLHQPKLRLGGSWTLRHLRRVFGLPLDVAWERMDEKDRKLVLYGDDRGEWEGVIPALERRFRATESDYVKHRIMDYMSELPCPACGGARLKPEVLAVKIAGKNIHQFCAMTVRQALRFLEGLRLSPEKTRVTGQVIRSLKSRLRFMVDVGLYYITLDRSTGTLSGGEAQRIRLATQIGSGLVGVCYCLDEPTIGLHARDNRQLIDSLLRLRDLGNTLIVVEHDEQTIRASDWVIDLGPGAGHRGGGIVVAGTPKRVERHPDSLTGLYLGGRLRIPTPEKRRVLDFERAVVVRGARANNLKDITVRFPLGGVVCVTGVSGSGKSTLIEEVLYKGLRRTINGAREKPGAHDAIEGVENVTRVSKISQTPIGRTPRSNPATYSGAFTHIRDLFARTKEARIRGYKPGRFSFNVKGGRCEACAGQGTKRIEMLFLPDVHVRCEVCRGARYNRETLDVRYRGKNIDDVLKMRVEEALQFFETHPALRKILRTLHDVGLGYMTLGQPSTTLSGGEAQRMKLAAELAKGSAGDALYLMDEPTIGLHPADIHRLLEVVNRLVEKGGSFVIIEHNLDVIKTADWIIDLGPGGGEEGGGLVAEGTPETVARKRRSVTGRYLREVLKESRAASK